MPSVLFLNKAPPYRHTGAEQVVWNIARHLATEGWDVHVLCPEGDNPPIVENLTFHHVSTPDSFFMEKAAFFLKGIPRYHRLRRMLDPDLVYDNVSPFPFLYAHIVDRDRLVAKAHAIYGISAFQNKNHILTKVGTLVGEQVYRTMDGSDVLAISESTQKRVASLVRHNPENVTVVNNGIDTAQFDYCFNPDGPVLSLCELTPRKNISALLRAWAHLERSGQVRRELIVAGDGPRRDYLESLSTKLALSSVSFVGYVPESRKIELFRSAFCYVLPTRMEGFGLTNLEAMASGCVVVSTKVPGVQDYLVDGENGYTVRSDDSVALANRLRTILKDPAGEKSVAAEGRRTAEVYTVENAVEAEEEVLESIIEAERGKGSNITGDFLF